MDVLVPVLYSAAVSVSQVISTKIPITVIDTNVIRSSAVGAGCILFLMTSKSAPSVFNLPLWVTALSVLSGVIMFFAAVTYVCMLRQYGVIATGMMTTAFGFIFATIAGNLMKEKVAAKTYVAMILTCFAIVLHKC